VIFVQIITTLALVGVLANGSESPQWTQRTLVAVEPGGE
jgi:hypothetical protein